VKGTLKNKSVNRFLNQEGGGSRRGAREGYGGIGKIGDARKGSMRKGFSGGEH